MKKLVIQTQYLENYAAWDWDGQGQCPQGWKPKGGSTYVLPNCGADVDMDAVVDAVSPHITTNNDHTREYIISYEVVDSNVQVCEDWETVTEFNFIGGTVNFMKVTDNREDGLMRRESLEKIETWTMGEGYMDRNNYKVEFLMEDGDFVVGNDELVEWLDAAEAA